MRYALFILALVVAAFTVCAFVFVPMLPDDVLNVRGLALKHAVRDALP